MHAHPSPPPPHTHTHPFPKHTQVVIGGEDLSSNKRVTQIVEVVPEFEREKLLRGLLQKYHAKRDNRILVFALYKKEAARLEQSLQRAGYACLGIHGDKSQTVRDVCIHSACACACACVIDRMGREETLNDRGCVG
jgi:ATP-dependent RNA helicase DBP3